ncbi:MAG TPA: flagellar basal-body rod protein FlgG [Ignavibacteriaceae bacterium]|jgi:flagellar basal-body rod protein FlgG|nr:flagellar basal-body rod protein FlgG [Ignavibacteriaceae bacterium]
MPTRSLRTAASGMYAQQINIQVISNNIANMNTTSFKKNRADFKDLMYQEVSATPLNSYLPGVVEKTQSQVQVGNGVQLSSTQKLFNQGDLTTTGNQLDVAIYGEGFFQLRKPDGTIVYSRDGSFKLSSDGSLVTTSGYMLEPGFTISDNVSDIAISRDGIVSMRELNGNSIELGQIELAKFINSAGLIALGDNMYGESDASGAPILGNPGSTGYGELQQGFLEASNVDIVEEMIAMITAQRAYEINSKTVKTVEDMMTMVNNLKRS